MGSSASHGTGRKARTAAGPVHHDRDSESDLDVGLSAPVARPALMCGGRRVRVRRMRCALVCGCRRAACVRACVRRLPVCGGRRGCVCAAADVGAFLRWPTWVRFCGCRHYDGACGS